MKTVTVVFCSVLLNWNEWRCEDVQSSDIRRRVETSCDCCDSQHLHVPFNTGFTERYESYTMYNFWGCELLLSEVNLVWLCCLIVTADFGLSIWSLADKKKILKWICQLSEYYLVIQITEGKFCGLGNIQKNCHSELKCNSLVPKYCT